MLEALDTIDWSRLGTCYQHSEDIPVALRNMTSDDATIRNEAFGTLHMELTHQGTIYEAAIFVVPFLLELLAAPQMRDKHWLVILLANLGSEGAYLGEIFQKLATRLEWKDLAEGKDWGLPMPQEQRDAYRMWNEKTHQAVREGLPLFLSLLANNDPVMRMKIAYAFTFFPEDTSWLSPPVVAQLKEEKDEQVIPCLLLCLGYLRSSAPEVASLLMQYLLEAKTDLLRFVAAMALCLLLQEKTPEEVVHVLFVALTDPNPLQPLYEALPPEWGSCWVDMRALLYLDQLMSSSHRTLIMKRLIEVFPFLASRVDGDCADLLLRAAFYEKGFQFHRQIFGRNEHLLSLTFDALDPMQQQILRLIAAKEPLWQEPPWPQLPGLPHRSRPVRMEALAHLGLPSTLQELQAYIASADRR